MQRYTTAAYETINNYQIKFKFQRTDTISKNNHTLHKGMSNGQTKILKIMRISPKDLNWHRQILQKKKDQYEKAKSLSCFSAKNIAYEYLENNNQLYLRILAPYVHHQSLQKHFKKYEDQFQKKCKMIDLLVKKVIEFIIQAPNNILYSVENIFWNQESEKIEINWLSFAGLSLLTNKSESISFRELKEIIELLDTKLFDQEVVNKRFNVKLKIRALGVIILSLILGKRVSLLLPKESLDTKTTIQKVKNLINESHTFISGYLNDSDIKGKILKIQANIGVNYLFFLNKVFNQEKELSWTEVIDYVIPKLKYQKVKNNLLNLKEIAQKLYQHEDEKKKKQFLQKGIGRTDLKTYFIVKLGVPISLFYGFDSLEDYYLKPHTYNLNTEMIFKKTLKLIVSLQQIEMENAKSQQNKANTLPFSDLSYIKLMIKNFLNHKSKINFNKAVFYQNQEVKMIEKYLSLIQ